MRVWARVDAERYRRIPLLAHAFLDGVPVHDVWQVRLPGGGPDRTLADARALLSGDGLRSANLAVRALFGLRRWLGRVFDLDREPTGETVGSYVDRLTPEDRQRSLVEPGSADGPFTTLYAFPNEAVSEARNATVHAFLVYALERRDSGYVLTWAIHVAPVSALTPIYMTLIAPFRRFIVYPSILKLIHRRWIAAYPENPEDEVPRRGS